MIDLSEKLDPEFVFNCVSFKEKKISYRGYLVNAGSKRYLVFQQNQKCVKPDCGREISYAILQCHHIDAGKGIGHFNF
jgi:hypothetical protein